MSLIRISENDFLDIDKVDHFFMEEDNLICVTSAERITIPQNIQREILTALFRNDMSKKLNKQTVSV